MFIQHGQYHGCWWPDDAKSQGISSHGIALVLLEYSRLASDVLNLYMPNCFEKQIHKSVSYHSSPITIYIDDLVQDCSNSSALAMELLQSCAKPLIWQWWLKVSILKDDKKPCNFKGCWKINMCLIQCLLIKIYFGKHGKFYQWGIWKIVFFFHSKLFPLKTDYELIS